MSELFTYDPDDVARGKVLERENARLRCEILELQEKIRSK